MNPGHKLRDLSGYNNAVYSEIDGGMKLSFSAEGGDASMRSYPVFPGIGLIYKDIHAGKCTFDRTVSPDVFEIHHCREGRFEGRVRGELFYIGRGDLSICRPHNGTYTVGYPLHHYHGISVLIDVEKAPKCLSCFLQDVNVEPRSLMEKFCTDNDIFIARSMPSISHIFSELYSLPEQIRTGYLKVKVLELMLFLTAIDTKSDELTERCCTPGQKLLARKVSNYLSAHMDRRVTLDQLSGIFHVSGTQIKSSVKNVFGVSLYTMIRAQKMQAAAKILLDTDRTILDIAGQFGYDNASKFAAAFKAVMGSTPSRYRASPCEPGNIFSE